MTTRPFRTLLSTVFVAIALTLASLTFVACSGEPEPTPASEFNITYYYNYTGAPNDGVYSFDTVAAGGTLTLPTAPTRAGHTFMHWTQDRNGAVTLDLTAAVTQNLDLYAQWRETAAEPTAPTLTGITVTQPTKTTYIVGEELDLAGMAVKAQYSDSTEKSLEPSKYTLSGYDKTAAGEQTITVTHDGKTATFKVTVNQAAPTLTGITVTPPTKTTYLVGEAFAPAGMTVKAKYSDNAENAVTDYTCAGYDKDKIGEQTITVTYNGKTTTFKVTVNARLTGIAVTTKPKTQYYIDDHLDLTGLVVTGTFSDSTSRALASSEYSSSDNYDKTKAGTYTVTITSGEYTDTFTVTVEVRYYAVTFSAANGDYTVSGAPETPASIAKGAKLAEPAPSPACKGFTFRGWYTDAACSAAYDFNVAVNADISLYAKWEAKSYTISYNLSGGGTQPESATYTATNGAFADFDLAAMSTRDHYAFSGWHKTVACTGTPIVKLGYADIAALDSDVSAITLYGKYTPNEYSISYNLPDTTDAAYTVSWDGAEPSGAALKYTYGTSKALAENITVTKKADSDTNTYTFIGWLDGDMYVGTSLDSTDYGDKTLTAKIVTGIVYTVTYNRMWPGADNIVTEKVVSGGKAPHHTPSRNGYTLEGWYTDDQCSAGYKYNFATATVTGNITLYANWTPVEYNVVFDANGGKFENNATSATVKGVYNTRMKQPNANGADGALKIPSKVGHTLEGWYTNAECQDSSRFNFDTSLTAVAGFSLYAKWTPQVYTVTFDADGGSAVSSMQVSYNGTIATSPSTSKSGYTHKGWNTTKDSETTNVVFGTSGTAITGDITFYAVWELIQYSINYTTSVTVNGVEVSATAPTKAGYSVTEGEVALLAPTGITAGYTFTGWKKDGEGENVTALSVGLFDANTTVTLVAQYAKIKYTVTYVYNNGTANMTEPVEYGNRLAVTDPNRYGWGFVGWYKNDGTHYDKTATIDTQVTAPSTAITLYAKWSVTTEGTFLYDGASNVALADATSGGNSLVFNNVPLDNGAKFVVVTRTNAGYGTEYRLSAVASNTNYLNVTVGTGDDDGKFVVAYNVNNYKGASWKIKITTTTALDAAGNLTVSEAAADIIFEQVPANVEWRNPDGANVSDASESTAADNNVYIVGSFTNNKVWNLWSSKSGEPRVTISGNVYTFHAVHLKKGDMFKVRVGAAADEYVGEYVGLNTAIALSSGNAAPHIYLGDGFSAGRYDIVFDNSETKQLTIKTAEVVVTFKNGESMVDTKVVSYDGTIALATAPGPTKTGHRLLGWSTNPNAAAADFKFGESGTQVTTDITLYAVWQKEKYTVSFDVKGGGGTIAEQQIEYEGRVAEFTAPTFVGRKLVGWYYENGEQQVDWVLDGENATKVTGNVTLCAKWELNGVTQGKSYIYYSTDGTTWQIGAEAVLENKTGGGEQYKILGVTIANTLQFCIVKIEENDNSWVNADTNPALEGIYSSHLTVANHNNYFKITRNDDYSDKWDIYVYEFSGDGRTAKKVSFDVAYDSSWRLPNGDEAALADRVESPSRNDAEYVYIRGNFTNNFKRWDKWSSNIDSAITVLNVDNKYTFRNVKLQKGDAFKVCVISSAGIETWYGVVNNSNFGNPDTSIALGTEKNTTNIFLGNAFEAGFYDIEFNLASQQSPTLTIKRYKPPTVTGIEVTTKPKTSYYVGENLGYIGMVVTATNSDNATAAITNGYTVSCAPSGGGSAIAEGAQFTAAGTYTVTVTHTASAKETTFEITVVNQPATYTIEYELNGGTNADGNVDDGVATKTFIGTDFNFELAYATKTDYTFGGWYTENSDDASSKVTAVTQASFTGVADNTLTLYAIWKVTVTFDLQGGNTADAFENQVIAINGKATDPGTPTRKETKNDGIKSYRFAGWYEAAQVTTGMSAWSFTTGTIPQNKTLYAHYVDDLPLGVDLDFISENDYPHLVVIRKTQATFESGALGSFDYGVKFDYDSTKNEYKLIGVLLTENDRIKVRCGKNDTDANCTLKTINAKEAASCTEIQSAGSGDGYDIKITGWFGFYYRKDGKELHVTVVPQYTVTFDATTNGGTLSGSETLKTDADGKVSGNVPNASMSDEDFLGWSTDAAGSLVDLTTYTFNENKTLYALFSAKSATLGADDGIYNGTTRVKEFTNANGAYNIQYMRVDEVVEFTVKFGGKARGIASATGTGATASSGKLSLAKGIYHVTYSPATNSVSVTQVADGSQMGSYVVGEDPLGWNNNAENRMYKAVPSVLNTIVSGDWVKQGYMMVANLTSGKKFRLKESENDWSVTKGWSNINPNFKAGCTNANDENNIKIGETGTYLILWVESSTDNTWSLVLIKL